MSPRRLLRRLMLVDLTRVILLTGTIVVCVKHRKASSNSQDVVVLVQRHACFLVRDEGG